MSQNASELEAAIHRDLDIFRMTFEASLVPWSQVKAIYSSMVPSINLTFAYIGLPVCPLFLIGHIVATQASPYLLKASWHQSGTHYTQHYTRHYTSTRLLTNCISATQPETIIFYMIIEYNIRYYFYCQKIVINSSIWCHILVNKHILHLSYCFYYRK